MLHGKGTKLGMNERSFIFPLTQRIAVATIPL
jgi:hypothetical protein